MKKVVCLILVLILTCGVLFAGGGQNKSSSGGPVEVKLWGDADKEACHDLIAAEFNRRNPGIRVTFDNVPSTEDFRDTIKPAINSGQGPDLYNYDTGPTYLGMMVNSGLVLDLTSYAKKYNWNNRFMAGSLDIASYNGKLYALPNELEIIGVYYNKKAFADLGIVPPKNSYQEFLDICQKFVDKGITPVLMDCLDQWQVLHFEEVWMTAFAGPQKVQDAISRKIKWTDPDLILAIDKLSEFIHSNYVNRQINSIGYDDANNMFTAGQYPMRITGTWMVDRFNKVMGDNLEIFPLPPGKPGIPYGPSSGFGSCLTGNSKTKHPDEVAAFMDFYFSDFACKVWYENNYIPSVKGFDYSGIPMIPLFKNVVDVLAKTGMLGTNIDVLVGPRVNDATMNYGQQLINGTMNGTRAMELKQKAHEEDLAAGD